MDVKCGFWTLCKPAVSLSWSRLSRQGCFIFTNCVAPTIRMWVIVGLVVSVRGTGLEFQHRAWSGSGRAASRFISTETM